MFGKKSKSDDLRDVVTIERTSDALEAVLHEPGKMDTRVQITEAQLPWFNALRFRLEQWRQQR